MNVTDLLKDSSGLIDALQDAGVPADRVGPLGDAIGQQLGGGLDLGDLLGGLDTSTFLSKLDVRGLAEQVGLTPDVVNRALALIAPKVEEFAPGGIGGLKSLAGKFLNS
jgi:hypothetical protein